MNTNNPYQLAAPSQETTLDTLMRVFSAEKTMQIWQDACQQTNLSQPQSLDDLELIFKYFTQQGGVLGIYGMSLAVRLSTFKNLKKLNQAS